MSIGLLALLDDVAALVKVSAASLDDISTQVAKTSGKVSGIVIDDAAVTPKYVVGLNPQRELSVIYRIAKKSLINKFLFLGPAVLLLGYFMPWIIQPILMVGGAYLCFEGYEKVHSLFSKSHHVTPAQANDSVDVITPQQLEDMRVTGAVRTDFILSAEIIAITYATVADKNVLMQIIVMACVAVVITVSVYGFVGLIVKADDIGLHMAKQKQSGFARFIGRSLVKFMPLFLVILGYIGTAAMLWVGAEIIAHGIPVLHHGLDIVHSTLSEMPVTAWLVNVTLCATGGLILGGVIAQILHFLQKAKSLLQSRKSSQL